MSLKRKWLTLEEKINVLKDFAKTKSSHRQLAERMKSRKQIDDRTQSMPIQSVLDVEAISSSTCIISTAPAADVLDTVVDPLGRIHSFTFPAQLDSVIWMKSRKQIDDRTQSMPIQSVVDVEAIS
uniref:Uncharacterized protein n=1 Tax=Rhodnius prolixus TaxID=13249 RepID=T1HVT7_RHOPR